MAEKKQIENQDLEGENLEAKQDKKIKKEEQEMIDKEQEAIKKYQLKEGNYQISIRILEGNELIPKPSDIVFFGSDDVINSFAEIHIGDKMKKTKVREKTFSPVWNKGFSFKLKDMSKQELENTQLKFVVKDKKSVLDTVIIGQYDLDLTSVYFQYQHELYMTWLTLTDPEDKIEGVTGYLRVNIVVLGPEDEPPVHNLAWQKGPSANKDKALIPKKVKQTGHQIKCDILRGENLAPVDKDKIIGGSLKVQAYTKVKYAGQQVRTKIVESTDPQWDEQLYIQCMLPNNSKYITITVFDHDYTSEDDIIGTAQIPYKSIASLHEEPRYINLYGPPLQVDNEQSNLMALYGQELGSHFRGRLLYKISSYSHDKPKNFKKKLKFDEQKNPYPFVPQKNYILRVSIIEGIEVPEREKCCVHVGMGQYQQQTTYKYDHDSLLKDKKSRYKKGDHKVKSQKGYAKFFERLKDQQVYFPTDIEQVPDIIFYFADSQKEKQRHSFCRIKAKDILCNNMQEYQKTWKPRILKLKEDKALALVEGDEFPGFLYVQVALIAFNAPKVPMNICLQRPLDQSSLQFVQDKMHNRNMVLKHKFNEYLEDEKKEKKIPRHIVSVQEQGNLSDNLRFSFLNPALQDNQRYFITFRVLEQQSLKDLIYIGLFQNTNDGEDITNDHQFQDLFKQKKQPQFFICSNGSANSYPKSDKNPDQSKFSFQQGDSVMLDLYLCSQRTSFIKFTKYDSLNKNSDPKGTTTFFFEFSKEEQLYVSVGLNSQKSKVEFLVQEERINNALEEKDYIMLTNKNEENLVKKNKEQNQNKIPQKFLRQQHPIQLQQNFNAIAQNPEDKKKYQLRVFLYNGKEIPPSDENGTSDPFVQIKCAGSVGYSNVVYDTLNPGWFQTICIDVDLNFESSIVPPGMFVGCYDFDEDSSSSSSSSSESEEGLLEIKRKRKINPIMENAQLIGRVWVPFNFQKEQFSVPKYGIFSRKTVHRVLDIVDPSTVKISKANKKLKQQRLLALLSKPVEEYGKKEFFIKIQGMNSSKNMLVGFSNINLEREQNYGSRLRLSTEKEKDKENVFLVSATGRVYQKESLNEHPTNKQAFKNENFHFSENDVVRISVDFEQTEIWIFKKKKFIGSDLKIQYLVTPVTITVFNSQGQQKCQNTYIFGKHSGQGDQSSSSESDISDIEPEFLQRSFYLSVGLTCDEDRDSVKFLENENDLTNFPKVYLNQKDDDKNSGIANVYYSHPKSYQLMYDPTNQKAGQIYMGYAIVEKENSDMIPVSDLKPESVKFPLYIYFIGIRDIEMEHPEIGEPRKISTSFDISGDRYDPEYVSSLQVKRRGINVNKLLNINVDMFTDKDLCSVMDILAWECSKGDENGERKMFGGGSLNIQEVLDKILERHFYQNYNQEKKQDLKNQSISFKDTTLGKQPQIQQADKDIEEEEDNDEQEIIKKDDSNQKQLQEGIIEKQSESNNFSAYFGESYSDNDELEGLIQKPEEVEEETEQKSDDPKNQQDIQKEENIPENKDPGDQKQKLKDFERQKTSKLNGMIEKGTQQKIPVLIQDQEILSFKCCVGKYSVFMQILKSENSSYVIECWTNQKSQAQIQEQNIQQNTQNIKKFQVNQISFTLASKLVVLDEEVMGYLEQSQVEKTIEKIKQYAQQAEVQFLENFVSFSDTFKHPDITIDKSKLTSSMQIQSEQQELKISILEPMLQRATKYTWKMKVQKLVDEIGVGICHQRVLDTEYESPLNLTGRGHGMYMLTSSGRMFSNFNKKVNGKKIQQQNAKYDQYQDKNIFSDLEGNNIITMEIDAVQSQISYKVDGTNIHLTQQILYSHESYKNKQDIFKNCYVCVALKNKEDKISFLSGDKVVFTEQQLRLQQQQKKEIVKKEDQKEKNDKNLKKVEAFTQSLSKKSDSSLLSQIKSLVETKKEIQEDYDTDPEEDLSIQPEWIKKRKILNDELEDTLKPSKKMIKIPLKYGACRTKKNKNFFERLFISEPPESAEVGYLKCKLFPKVSDDPVFIEKWKQSIENQKSLMVQQQYICRVYVTRGIAIGGEGMNQDLYLQMNLGEEDKELNEQLKKQTLVKDTNNPDFYISQDFPCNLPGSSVLTISLHTPNIFGSDDLIGETKLDVEERYFTKKWKRLNDLCLERGIKKQKMPIEQRNLVTDDGGTAGRIGMWLEIIPRDLIKKNPPIFIFPPPQFEFELRVIVWETRNCVIKDELEECNDLYVRGGLAKGGDQETDIHWRCRGKGSFNWRMKFNVKFPMISQEDYGNDRFRVALYDKDLIGSDDLIGEAEIDLNYHNMINKAIKRYEKTEMKTSLYVQDAFGNLIPKQTKSQKRKQREKEKEQEKKKKQKNSSGNYTYEILEDEEEGEEGQKEEEIRSVTNKIWYDVFNPAVKVSSKNDPEDEIELPQGQVLMSFELVPKEIALKQENGTGRDQPNQFPVLPEPEGRLNFNILHPLQFLKEILGAKVFNSIMMFCCCTGICGFLIYFFVLFFNNVLAEWVADDD